MSNSVEFGKFYRALNSGWKGEKKGSIELKEIIKTYKNTNKVINIIYRNCDVVPIL